MKKLLILIVMIIFISPVFAGTAGNDTLTAPPQDGKQSGFLPGNNEDAAASGIDVPAQKYDIDYVEFEPYLRYVERKVKSAWTPAEKIKNNFRIIVRFEVMKDGNLGEYSIVKSTAEDAENKNVLDIVIASAPFEPLPTSFKGDKIIIQLTFDCHVWNNSNFYNKNLSRGFLHIELMKDSPSVEIRKKLDSRKNEKLFDTYMLDVKNRLMIISYSKNTKSIVRVRFTIQQDGSVSNMAVVSSGGDMSFKEEILKQIKDISFMPIPLQLGVASIPVEYQFSSF